MFPAFRHLQPLKVSVRARLALIQMLMLTALLTISVIAWHAINDERHSGAELAMLSRAERLHLNADTDHDALQADVNAALGLRGDAEEAGEILASTRENSRRLEANIEGLREFDLPADLEDGVAANEVRARAYIALSNKMVASAVRNHEQAAALEPEFVTAFEALGKANDQIAALLSRHVEAAEADTIREAAAAKLWIVIASVIVSILACFFVGVIGTSIRRSLRQVSDAARALAAGNLSVRSEVGSHDEVGELAGAVNKMADELQSMIGRLLADADRDAFRVQIVQALEMADTEHDVQSVVSRAMVQIGGMPMELLLSDPNRSALQRAVVHPIAGAPGCDVESPGNCAAVRRASPVVFEDSESLNACPRLRNRPCGPISAACVPVGFMGRSFGVLHAVAAVRKPPSPQQVAQLTTLGAQAGARIGSVRAFERTQQHAYTDALTGLRNRRALEQILADPAISSAPYAFALADLDHFKALNDTYGHDAGDKALRLFAEVLKKAIRQADHAARWGGEEFAILFAHATAGQALEVIDRIRADLAEALITAGTPPFTASFGIGDTTMASSFDEVLRVADEALYRSKNNGRDRVLIGLPAATEPPGGAEQGAGSTAAQPPRFKPDFKRSA